MPLRRVPIGDPHIIYCNQCNRPTPKLILGFNKKTKTWFTNCPTCRVELRAYPKTKPEDRIMKTWRTRTDPNEQLRATFKPKSGNRKTGPIPVTVSSPHTCPPSCSWYGNGCYAENGYMGGRWRKVPLTGISWDELCAKVKALPDGQLWRHNEAGDLPGRGEEVNGPSLYQLVEANEGKRGFTYTHKKNPEALFHAAIANRRGFTINVSCDNEEEVDQMVVVKRQVESMSGHDFNPLPLALVVPTDDTRRQWRTAGGNYVLTCPAQLREDVTCLSCGLCAIPTRKAVIAFRAHGNAINIVSLRASQRRLPLVQ